MIVVTANISEAYAAFLSNLIANIVPIVAVGQQKAKIVTITTISSILNGIILNTSMHINGITKSFNKQTR